MRLVEHTHCIINGPVDRKVWTKILPKIIWYIGVIIFVICTWSPSVYKAKETKTVGQQAKSVGERNIQNIHFVFNILCLPKKLQFTYEQMNIFRWMSFCLGFVMKVLGGLRLGKYCQQTFWRRLFGNLYKDKQTENIMNCYRATVERL